jgi:3-methylcrotonyl-CoA carboxylase alpha subunit
MLAKLVCHAPSRDAALRTMHRALAETDVVGVVSNVDLLGRIVAHPGFHVGGVDTGFIEQHRDELLAPQREPPAEVLGGAALAVLSNEAAAARQAAAASHDPYSPWHACDQFWPNIAREREMPFGIGEQRIPVKVRREGRAWQLMVKDKVLTCSAASAPDGRIDVWLDGMRETIVAMRIGDSLTVRRNGETWRLQLPDPMAAAAEEDDAGGRLVAPLPGQVTQVSAEPGMPVTRGQVMVVLEAMKTVFRLAAPADGVVATVSCQVGDSVVEGQVLVGFAEPEATG